jgi:hypothetical protein
MHREGEIAMKAAVATAEVFLTAFEALPRSQREVVLQHLFANPALKEDLIAVAGWYERRAERPMSYEKIRDRLKRADWL